ncbi:MAG: M1 family metallopeptidase, partial [Chloroflexi bacterium]|nr:M1 family metallopeptidase [Chloroflexota bacterium]
MKRLLPLLLAALLLLLVCAACSSGARTEDPWEPYRQTMRPATQGYLDGLDLLPVYDLRVTLNADRSRLAGIQTVRFPNTTSDTLPEVVFRLYPNMPRFGGRMDVQSVQVNGVPVDYEYNVSETALEVRLPTPLESEKVAELRLTYAVRIPRSEANYVLFGATDEFVSLPYFYPMLALRDAQGWHRSIAPTYADASSAAAALYNVSFTGPADLRLVAPGTLISHTVAAEGQATWQYRSGPIREFMFIGSPAFQSVEEQVGDVAVRSWFLPGDGEAGRAALVHAVAALRVYQQWFGPYPYPEVAVVQAPLGHHGMEFPHVNLIGGDLYRERRDELEYLVVHEVA